MKKSFDIKVLKDKLLQGVIGGAGDDRGDRGSEHRHRHHHHHICLG